MQVLVSGGGKVGRQLARLFADAGHSITVVDLRADRLEGLKALGPGVEVAAGDATDPEVLRAAGAEQADVFVAATGSDEANMLSCFLARLWFGISRTIARVNDPRNEHMFTTEYGCDAAISHSSIIARMVLEETGFFDLLTLFRLHRGELALVEGEVHEGSSLAGKTLAAAKIPPETVVLAIIRGDHVSAARGQAKMRPGDRLLALSARGSEDAFHDLLMGKSPG